MRDFDVSKFYAYKGPSEYLDRQALVFNLYLHKDGYRVDFYEKEVYDKFPEIEEKKPENVVDLFAEVLIQILKMDIDLFINKYSITTEGEEYIIAVEYLDDYIAEDCVYFVSDWFKAINADRHFDFDARFTKLQQDFDKTLFGGPTLYSLIEAGLKRNIPVTFLFEENQFMWGYGFKNVRGRSTTFSVDGIKDTEFTMYKDMVKDFLLMCGFPTPVGKNTYTVEEAIEEAEKLGYPVVVKPLAGHKGQGVTTNIESPQQVEQAFNNIYETSEEGFEGAIVEKQIYGTDHRLLCIGGKFAAALERVPAYVDGNGRDDIERLILFENDKIVRLDNARSPLCKIKIDDDLLDYLELQDLSLRSIPKEGERIYLRRVANISAGGVSINVTDKIHPKNKKMVEDIGKFFNVTCLGIDVLAKDISQPWDEGDFGIIEINAGPGVFMHLAPAIGGSIDVPGKIIRTLIKGEGRIPILAGNKISAEFCKKLKDKVFEHMSRNFEFASLTDEGVAFNGVHFYKNEDHAQNVKIILRNPKCGFAAIQHTKEDIYDYGTLHLGSDIAVLDNAVESETHVMKRDLSENGILVIADDNAVQVFQGEEVKASYEIENLENKDDMILEAIVPFLKDIIEKRFSEEQTEII